ncbi:Chitin synthase, class 3 [Coemansia asiatica]|uniref:chitin synthase n=1 Tax=Coemansia asiatica TaxID=1052880 RepID=A0A9W7XIJ0_9FUNG|nr:Chitin synthase, class 3 [Coemansia asiatica]
MGSNNYYNNGTFDSQNNNNNQQQQQYSQQYEQHAATNSDGFDGVLSGSNTQAGGSSAVGYFGLTEHNNSSSGVAGGVELELMSNTSSNTRNDAVRDRLDHRTASDISSSHGASNGPHNAEQPLISGEPLLQGIGEVPVGTPEKRTTGKDDTKHIHRRRKPKKGSYDEDDDDDDAQAGAYSSYQAPQRTRSLVRPERAVSGGGVAGTGQAGGKQSVLTRSGTASRARNSTSGGMRQRRKQQQVVAAAARRKRWCPHPWQTYCRVVTFWAPGRVLKCFGMAEPAVQMAWREKMGLVSIILAIMAVIAFLTFGLQQVLCGLSGKQTRIKWNEVGNGYAVVNGRAYDITKFKHAKATPWTGGAGANIMGEPANAGGKDLSFLFQNPNSACKGVLQYDSGMLDAKNNVVNVFPCVYYNNTKAISLNQIPNNQGCHNTAAGRRALAALPNTPIQYSWSDVHSQSNLVVFNGAVLDLLRGQFLLSGVKVPSEMEDLIKGSMRGKDISLHLPSGFKKQVGNCMLDLFRVGSIDASSLGCIAANIELYVSLIVILGGVLAKFVMAVYFGWFMGPRLGQVKKDTTPEDRRVRRDEIEAWADVNNHVGKEKLERKYTVMGNHLGDTHGRSGGGGGGGGGGFGAGNNGGGNRMSRFFPTTSRYSHFMPGDEPGARDKAKPTSSHARGGRSGAGGGGGAGAMPRHSAFFSDHRASQFIPDDAPAMEIPSQLVLPPPQNPPAVASPFNFELAYTLLLVTCYSEGSHGIRTTLDSLCGTDYPASHKCLFIICDGLIKGAGEEMYTPDVCLSMMTDFVIPPDRVQPYSYVSIAQGAKRHNMAKLYAGYYAPNELSPEHARNNRVPMILVVKCGTPEEASEAKPGNRGKRDSQIILMSFLQRVMFDERMTELEYELFNAMWNVTGVTPDNFEIVLMVDADTKVYVDSVTVMVKAMVDDPSIMGQCGETKIANKTDSWVTMIQVFEYYIAHHQAKAFESVFGGVTCLPGCFCMYRIKAPKGQHGYWVPILANPDIVENYSENVVDTLHKKNLLLLGEDRYLSTLMLRTFPKRKMMFIPSSVCKTIVPDEFKVLLSQRRRWINSTVHNLGELVLVNDLCGTFCLSMQFMIFMDLIGTLALPAAIAFTFYVVIISTFTRPVPWLPLALLGVILGLPAVLIGLTSRKLVYIGWMLIYLCSLPIWNFVLPTYAYWHFDDFSWGQTRMVQGEGKDKGHGEGNGEFDSSQIVMKRWCDFEAEKRRKTQVILGSVPSLAALAVSSSRETPSLGSRQSRVMVASRPVSIANSGSSHRVNESPRLQTSDSADQLISTVGQAAVLQMAASKIDDLDAHAAAGSIERLGYMTPNIIPVLASQGLQQSLARGSSGMLSGLATPTGAAYPPSSFYSIGNGPMSPESPSYANYSANYSDASSAGVPAVPAIPQQYAPSSSPRSQRSREDTSAPSSGEKSTL